MSELEVLWMLSDKMFFAVICGACVGIEREVNHAAAGFKTQILICVGSMLFTVMPQISEMYGVSGEGGRIIAQIVSGVGFLGAGAIMHTGVHQVSGLTTAAWIWFTAAIGIMIGTNHGPAAVFTTFSLVLVIIIARKVERKYFGKKTHQFDEPKSNYKKSA